MTGTKLVVPVEEALLANAVDTLKVFCGMLLLSISKHGGTLRDTVVRNFIARGMACTESIFLVWRSESEQDAWILHRTLLDRLFHLHHLAQHDEFKAFEEFSFIKLYEARHSLLSDIQMCEQVPNTLKSLQGSHKSRYQQLLASKTFWRRPKAENVAKEMDLAFLYRYGYDYASTHVHPMASDGEADFYRLTSSLPDQQKPDATVVRNSILVQTLLIQEGMNASSVRWRKIVFDFLDQTRRFLADGSPEFQATLHKIGRA